MRFQVNEVLPVIAIMYNVDPSQNLMFGAYIPWLPFRSDIRSIEFEHLTVVEHHRVLTEYAQEDDVPDCDGYVLKSSKGETWHNQYPRASYSQTSDSADRLFELHFEPNTFDSWYDANPHVPCEYRLLSDYLKSLKRGIYHRTRECKEESEVANTALLQKHLDEVCALYKQRHGKEVQFSEHMIEGDRWLEGWWEVEFVEVQGEAA